MSWCLGLVLLLVLFYGHSQHLDLDGALFLTKNLIRELRQQYLPKWEKNAPNAPYNHTNGDNASNDCYLSLKKLQAAVLSETDLSSRTSVTDPITNITEALVPHKYLSSDMDYPFNSVVNSMFPLDSVIEYNVSNITKALTGRYASFSPILTRSVTSKYALFPHNACEELTGPHKEFHDKIVVLKRGECTFVEKVRNIVKSEMRPLAVVIGNNEPNRGLITMYSSSFNSDGSLKMPVLFVTYEDYRELQRLEKQGISLRISTATLGSWANLVLSMALSPPLLTLFFYLVIKSVQLLRRSRMNRLNQQLVKKMPVHIYNGNHLVDAKRFYDYLTATDQTEDLPNVTDDSDSARSLKPSPRSSALSLRNYIVNGKDVRADKMRLGVLTAPEDFYHTYKCSICLDKFKKLRLRVLVLECKHVFHEECLLNWLVNFRRSCPLCNSVLKPQIPLLAGDTRDYGSTDNRILDESLLENSQDDEEDLYEPPLDTSLLHSGLTEATIPEVGSLRDVLRRQSVERPALASADSAGASSYHTAVSELPPVRPSPFRYQRPLQILFQYSAPSKKGQKDVLSSSIDLDRPSGVDRSMMSVASMASLKEDSEEDNEEA